MRDTIGTGFPGGTYRQIFYVADVEAAGPAVNGELHVDLDEADFLGVFPLAGEGRARLIGTVRDERAERADTLTFKDVSDRAINHLKVQVNKVNWFSTYHVHHRVTHHFRKGRAFLLGDAAHIHSPAGGQGMNTGIGDAINLAWKLAAVIAGRAPVNLLDSYEAERIGFARRLVATTDRVFSFATSEGPLADFLRMRVAPLLFPTVIAFEPVREFMFRTVSQITLNYRNGPLSRGAAGQVHGGDRLPWARVDGKTISRPSQRWIGKFTSMARPTPNSQRGAMRKSCRFMSSSGDPGMRRRGSPAMRFICSDRIPTWRLPTAQARPTNSSVTSETRALGFRCEPRRDRWIVIQPSGPIALVGVGLSVICWPKRLPISSTAVRAVRPRSSRNGLSSTTSTDRTSPESCSISITKCASR